MKLVYLSDSIIPSRAANSIQVMKMCGAFAHNGHAVTLVAPDRPEQEADVDDVFGFYGVERNFGIVRAPWKAWKGRAYLYARSAARIVDEAAPDIVYGRALPACYFAARAHCEVIYESHSPVRDFERIVNWMFGRLIRNANFRHLVVITDALNRDYQRHYPKLRGRVRTAHDGADNYEPGQLEAHSGSNDRQSLQVGYVGQLYPGKGMELIAELAALCPWADFHVIGGISGDILRWKHEVARATNLQMHGFLRPAEVKSRILEFDVVLAPFQERLVFHGGGYFSSAQWLSPLKIFEYMAAARPIVCSDLPVLREVLNEQNSILVEPADVQAWARALGRLRDPELRRRIAAKAHADFAARYTWSARARKVLE